MTLNKTISLIFSAKSLLVSGFALIAALTSSIGQAGDTVSFYLPLHSKHDSKTVIELKQALNQAGINNIEIVTADYWQQYQQSFRNGKVGVYYGPPHFTAWAIEKHNFTALVKIKKPLQYVLASKKSHTEIFEVRDLTDKQVCTQSALNLDYLHLIDSFSESLKAAKPIEVLSISDELNNTGSACSAFSISNHWLLENPNHHYIRLSQSPVYSNYAISVHPSLSSVFSKELKKALQTKRVKDALAPLIAKSSNDPGLIEANNKDYPSHYTKSLKRFWRE